MTATGSRRATLTLPTDTQILIVRDFAAPRDRVFEAWTTPDLVRRWWHAGRGKMTDCRIDLRVGGTWRYAMVTPDGTEVAFHGEYREIVAGERLVTTEVYEGVPGGEDMPTVDTLLLDEWSGRTTATLLIEAPSKAVRDMIVESGMEDGLQDALDLLEGVAGSPD